MLSSLTYVALVLAQLQAGDYGNIWGMKVKISNRV